MTTHSDAHGAHGVAHGPAAQTMPGARGRWLELVLLSLAQFMLVLDISVVNIALPNMGRDLALPITSAGLVLTAYIVPFGGLMLLGGRAADLFGAKRLFLIGLALFSAASLLAGLATDAWMLIGARALQGIGAALLSPAALSTLMSRFEGHDRHRALAVWSGIGAVGVAAGVLLGGVLTSGPGWRWIFYINVPVGLLVGVALAWLLPSSARPRDGRSINLVAGLLLTGAIASLIYGINLAGTTATMSDWLLPMAGAVFLLAVFILIERRSAHAIINPALLGQRAVIAGVAVMVFASGLLIGSFFLLSFLLQTRLGWSPIMTGLAFLPVAIATLGGAHLGGHLLGRSGGKVLAAIGFGLAAGGFGLAVWSGGTVVLLIAGLSLAALGIGATFVVATSTAMSNVPGGDTGMVSGLVNTFHEFGGAIGVALLATVIAGNVGGMAAFIAALGFAAHGAFAAAVLGALLVPPGKPAAGTVRFMH